MRCVVAWEDLKQEGDPAATWRSAKLIVNLSTISTCVVDSRLLQLQQRCGKNVTAGFVDDIQLRRIPVIGNSEAPKFINAILSPSFRFDPRNPSSPFLLVHLSDSVGAEEPSPSLARALTWLGGKVAADHRRRI
jgi:hypothetical protein